MSAQAHIIEIADAVTSTLNAATFGQDFTAERTYVATFELPDLKRLKVTVVPRSKLPAAEAHTRGATRHDYAISVAVQKKFQEIGGVEKTEIDALMLLVEEIAGYLERRPLATCPDAKWIGTENAPVFIPEHIDELRQFTSVLTVTYRAAR